MSDIGKTPSSWFPDIAPGPNGSVHIIWSSGLPGKKKEDAGSDLLMYRELRDGAWSSINDIDLTGLGGYTVRNSIVMGHDGRLHMLVRRGLNVAYSSAPWDQSWSAGAWSEPRKLSGGATYFNALATDSRGVVHVFWNEAIPDEPSRPNTECPNCADLFYRSVTDDVLWSSPVNLSRSADGSVKPQVAVDRDDALHVVWEEGFDWYASKGTPKAGVYRVSHDGGETWDDPIPLTLPDVVARSEAQPAGGLPAPTPAPQHNAPRQIALGLFQQTAPIIVYRGNVTDQLYYQYARSDGLGLTDPAVLPGVRARNIRETDHDAYTMVTDGDGNVHLIVVGFLTSESAETSLHKLLHLVWNGSQWSAPDVVATDTSYPSLPDVIAKDGARLHVYPEWPRAVVSGGQLHVTWFTRNESDLFTSENAHYQVWYSAFSLAASALAPIGQFTPIPTIAAPTATAVTAAPSPTTLPAASLQADVIGERPSWETSGLRMVGLAVAMVAGLLAAMWLVGQMRSSRTRRS